MRVDRTSNQKRTPFLVFWTRGVIAWAGFGLSLAYCIVRVVSGVRRHTIATDTAHWMHRLICPPLGIRVQVCGASHMDARPCVYIANHQSYIDYPVLATMLGADTIVVGKSEMRKIPLVGWLFRITGNRFIARNDASAAQQTLEDLARDIRLGKSAWIFPEGTRRSTDDAMLRFRSGAFRLAAMANVPIVPVVLSSLKPEVDIRARRMEPVTLTISVLPPVHIDDASREVVHEAMVRVRDVMAGEYNRISKPRCAVGSAAGAEPALCRTGSQHRAH